MVFQECCKSATAGPGAEAAGIPLGALLVSLGLIGLLRLPGPSAGVTMVL
jgi:hypothetical protein